MFETSIDFNKMNNHKVDLVICCDIDDCITAHCNDKSIGLLADSPAREYLNDVIDTLDKSDSSTHVVKTPQSTQNLETVPTFALFIY